MKHTEHKKNGTTNYEAEPRQKAGGSVGANHKSKGARVGTQYTKPSSKRPSIGTGK